eukprot:gene149-biopygen25
MHAPIRSPRAGRHAAAAATAAAKPIGPRAKRIAADGARIRREQRRGGLQLTPPGRSGAALPTDPPPPICESIFEEAGGGEYCVPLPG